MTRAMLMFLTLATLCTLAGWWVTRPLDRSKRRLRTRIRMVMDAAGDYDEPGPFMDDDVKGAA